MRPTMSSSAPRGSAGGVEESSIPFLDVPCSATEWGVVDGVLAPIGPHHGDEADSCCDDDPPSVAPRPNPREARTPGGSGTPPDMAALLEMRRMVDDGLEATIEHWLEMDERLEAMGVPSGCAYDGDCETCPERDSCNDGDVEGDADSAAVSAESRWGSTVEAAAVGRGPGGAISRSTLDKLLKRLEAAGIDPAKLPGGPKRVGVGAKKVRWRWYLPRVGEFLAATDTALQPEPAQSAPAKLRKGFRGSKARRYGAADGRSPLARVMDPAARG